MYGLYTKRCIVCRTNNPISVATGHVLKENMMITACYCKECEALRKNVPTGGFSGFYHESLGITDNPWDRPAP